MKYYGLKNYKKVKRYLLGVAVLLVAVILFKTSVCRIYPSSNLELQKEVRDVTSFNHIIVKGSVDLVLTQGESFDVRVESPDLNYLLTTVSDDGTLLIARARKRTWRTCRKQYEDKVFVTVPDLNSLQVRGSSVVTTTSVLSGDQLVLDVIGSVDVSMELAMDVCELSIAGSADVQLTGMCLEQYLDVNGSADIFVSVQDILDIKVAGSATILYDGRPRIYQNIKGRVDVNSISFEK